MGKSIHDSKGTFVEPDDGTYILLMPEETVMIRDDESASEGGIHWFYVGSEDSDPIDWTAIISTQKQKGCSILVLEPTERLVP